MKEILSQRGHKWKGGKQLRRPDALYHVALNSLNPAMVDYGYSAHSSPTQCANQCESLEFFDSAAFARIFLFFLV